MRSSWWSRRGRERSRNSDAAALGQRGRSVLAVLVDGAEKGPGGAELARYWVKVGFQALAEESLDSSGSILARLEYEQAQLRDCFLHDVASYCLVRINRRTLLGEVWHCGDCRVGIRQQSGTRWLTTPHTMAHQPGLPSCVWAEEEARRARTLTRALTARRFETPEHISFELHGGQKLLLCTDGYWQEQTKIATAPYRPLDDASLLTISPETGTFDNADQDSDTDNFHHL